MIHGRRKWQCTTVLLLCYEVIKQQIGREMIEEYPVMNLHTIMQYKQSNVQKLLYSEQYQGFPHF